MATPHGPEPLAEPIADHVEEHRHLFCRSYDACLGRAIEEGWGSWTCAHCVRFRRLRRARIQVADRRALRGLTAPPALGA